jgi:BlaI family penicillinase repressor
MRISKKTADAELSRRERQIMDILFARGRATGQEIQEGLADKPNYSSVRTILRVLERKGYVRHFEEGLRYVYEPTVARAAASRSALQRIIRTFFDGSAKEAVAALLDPSAFHVSEEELKELARMIHLSKRDRAKKERK